MNIAIASVKIVCRVKGTRSGVRRGRAGAPSKNLGQAPDMEFTARRIDAERAESQERLKGVITGGSRGLGFAAASALVNSGAVVALIGKDAKRVAHAAATLDDGTGRVTGWATDVGQPQSLEVFAQVRAHLGQVDAVIASAAIMSAKASKLAHTSADHWREVLAINLDGVFHTMSAFVPSMIEARHGRMIVMSACLGRMSGPGNAGGLAPYRVSKAAVNALVRNTAAETGAGKRGVYVDAVCPGHCRTDMGGEQAPRSAQEGADTAVWLSRRGLVGGADIGLATGLLWEDREVVPW